MLAVQVILLSPFNSCPSLQLRDRTVPEETGNCLSVFMLVQVVFRPVQSEKVAINIITSSLFLNDLTILVTISYYLYLAITHLAITRIFYTNSFPSDSHLIF